MAIAGLMLERFRDQGLTQEDLLARLAWLRDVVQPRIERYLGYYRNPATELASACGGARSAGYLVRPWRQYQEIGLPARITGFRRGADGSSAAVGAIDLQRKEVVIENDIGWRMDTLVDFAASRLPGITSTAKDGAMRGRLNGVIAGILEAFSGGLARLLQEVVLQGAIAGSAWIQVRPSAKLLSRLGAGAGEEAALEDVSRWLELELVEARRACPVMQRAGGRAEYVAILHEEPAAQAGPPAGAGFLQRMRSWFGKAEAPEAEEFSFDLLGERWWQRYRRGILQEEGENPLGFLPLVRYENAGDPAAGTRVGPAGSGVIDAGTGDVEPLIGLQDELNTRLSDRAYRVTMSSFQMYLGKGIEDFVKRPVGPGQMWGTDNPQATIEAFGGDRATPSEAAHIEEIREALDKISGVSPVAAGLIRGKLGNLTSAVALRLTLIALLARTERKRSGLTGLLAEIVRMGLEMLDRGGIFKTAPEDRGIDVNWPTALPESDMDRLAEAQAKMALGVPRDVVLKELGYGELTGRSDRERGAGRERAETAVVEAAGDEAAEGAGILEGH